MEEQTNFLSIAPGSKDLPIKLEGLVNRVSDQKGVVITHPHPLYGGEMRNPIVAIIADQYEKKGYSTLRFNFRGTGRSEGIHDNGAGEQTDILSAVDYLKNSGIKNISLAGYSFGAWVNAHIDCKKAEIDHMTMVSPPVAFIDYSTVSTINCSKIFIISGSADELAPPDSIKPMLAGWNQAAEFKIVQDADHFYSGRMKELAEALASFIQQYSQRSHEK